MTVFDKNLVKVNRHEVGYEKIVLYNDPDITAVVSIKSLVNGVSVGGTRHNDYIFRHLGETDLAPEFQFARAYNDAKMLSWLMDKKRKAARLKIGGGKGVVIVNPKEKTDVVRQKYAELLESLGGAFITGEDSGTTVEDIEKWGRITKWVVGHENPAKVTAYGCHKGLEICIDKVYGGSKDWKDLIILVQGACGAVGSEWIKQYLLKTGCKLKVTDINPAVEEYKKFADVVEHKTVYGEECDIFLQTLTFGGTINDTTIKQLHPRVKILTGATNGILADRYKHAAMLQDREILFIPDEVINLGGITDVSRDLVKIDQKFSMYDFTPEEARERTELCVKKNLEDIFAMMDEKKHMTTTRITDYLEDNKWSEEEVYLSPKC